MSWINSDATKKQSSKNDLSFYHGFSKTPVEPTSNGTAATTLANASTKGGHTVIGTEVWAEEIPWFGLVASRAAAVTRLSGLTKLNDLVKVDGEGGKVYKYIGADDATFTEETWADFWQEVTLTNGMALNNRHNQPVLRYYLNQPMQTLTTTNNASIDSKGFATRLFVNEENHTGQTSGGSVVSQFAAGTDNIKNGIPSVELNPKLYYNTTEKIAGTHYYDYNVSGTILWNENVASKGVKISCFRYIGKTVTGQLSTVDETIKSHAIDISDIKAALGMESTNPDGTPSVTARVETVEDVVRVLLGLSSDAEIIATESIASSISAAEDRVKVTTDALAGRIAQLEGIQHFSVAVVDTLPETPVENTIYLVAEEGVAEGTYIEYIAYKPADSESVVTEKIGSTAIDLTGYTTDAEHEALQGRVSAIEDTTVPALEQSITDAKSEAATNLATARTEITAEIAQAKSEAIASAEVTITAGTGIVVTGEGKGTTFQIAVSDDIATAAALSALSQTVASNKTELEGKITAVEAAASTALETAKTEIKGTTDALDSRLTDAEAGIEALTSGDNSVAKQIETAVGAAQTTLQGNIDGVSNRVTELETVTVPAAVQAAQAAMTEAQAKVASVTGPAEGLVIVSGDKDVTITVSDTIATKDYADTAAANAVTTGLATDGNIAQAIATAKSGAEQTAATALSTARSEITTEISTAISGLETKLTTGEGSLGAKVTALEDSVKEINETTIPNAITTAQDGAVATVKALVLSASDTDDAGKVTVALGGTIETPSITVTSSDIASAQTLAELISTVNTHIEEAAGLYLSVEKVDTLPADADAKTNKIYLVPVDSEAGRAQNIHTEYIWTNGKWEIIGTTAIDINSLEASAKAAQDAADKAQGEVDALETVVETLTQTHNTDKATLENSIKGVNDTIAAMDATETVNGLTVTQVDGKITSITEALITASVPAGTTFVEGNVAYVGSTKHVIAPDKFQTAAQMPANLTSWVADLSNLTVGDNMFKGCTGLTVFVGDLSSLTSGVDMFNGCMLDDESLEILAENLPTVTGSPRIDLGGLSGAIPAHLKAAHTIQTKGWNVYSNGTPFEFGA